jgi:hypothetical protein
LPGDFGLIEEVEAPDTGTAGFELGGDAVPGIDEVGLEVGRVPKIGRALTDGVWEGRLVHVDDYFQAHGVGPRHRVIQRGQDGRPGLLEGRALGGGHFAGIHLQPDDVGAPDVLHIREHGVCDLTELGGHEAADDWRV